MPTVAIKEETKTRLDGRKIHPNVSYDEIIVTMLDYIEAQEKRE